MISLEFNGPVTKHERGKLMSNYAIAHYKNEARKELHDELGLTGAEISFNLLPPSSCVPFIHSHKMNEEVYLILSGEGKAVVDDDEISLKEGDCIRISPSAKRQFFADANASLLFVCIQTKQNSLEGYTADDAIL